MSSQVINRRRDDFLQHLLARESGLNLNCFDWYRRNLDNLAVIYPRVASPGVPVRHPETRGLMLSEMTIREYFSALGVDHLFIAHDPACLPRMQYAAINALGFVGYQFGEKILIEHGYYRPASLRLDERGEARCLETYYVGLPALQRPQSIHRLARDRATGNILSTPTNEWRGVFLGKNGIWTFDDLRSQAGQEAAIRDILTNLDQRLSDALNSRGLSGFHSRKIVRSVSISPEFPPVKVRCTRAGLLACAHLCGIQAVVEFLDHGVVRVDEFGTSIVDYLLEFADDRVDFDLR